MRTDPTQSEQVNASGTGHPPSIMAASQREFAVPVAPSPVLAQALAAYPHLAQSSPRTPEQPFPRNARSSSSKRAAVAERVSSKRLKKVERRVLPARIGTSTISSVSNELDDMVMECFSKAFLDTFRPSETTPVMITTEPVSTLRTSLLPALDHAPNWWNQEFSSFRRSTERRQARKAQIAAKLAEQSTTQSSPSPGTQRGSFARQQKQASHGSPLTGSPVPDPATSSRGLRARQVVQYTDSAVIKHETMDTSDDYYAQLHRKHEMGEKKQKLIESDKMSQARNKLKARTELLESTEDDTWCAHVERLLKKASRYAGDESQHEHSSGSSDNEMEDQRKLGRSKQMTEDELAEKVQRLVLLAGLELVKIKPIAQLREDLITEGRELLEKYDKTLGVRNRKNIDQVGRNGQADVEKRAHQISNEHERGDTPDSETRKAGSKRAKRHQIATSPASDIGSRSPTQDFEPLPVDAAARSDNESVYAESHQSTAKKNRSERRSSARRPNKPENQPRASRRETQLHHTMLPPLREPYFEPVTASGQPVLLEAAEKRLKIIEAEGAKKRTSTRALALPFGMPYSRMIEWNFQYDLDGDFWKPYREARLNGSFTLESVKAAEASGQNPLPIDTREDISSALAVQLPPSENDDGPPPSLLVQRGNNNILPPPPPISPPPPREPDHFSIAPDIKQRIMEQCMKEQGKRDIGPNSEREDPDIVPSSWNTEDAVASSGG